MINDISIKHQIALMMRFRTSFSSLVKYHHRSILFMVTRYEEDFKKSIVEMVKAGRRPDELANEYGPSTDSIRNWVKKYSSIEVNGKAISADERCTYN
ncbi:helix-turn-helix domain-containing protein [Leuconostoc mesenteroides]|uniref:helix-turn-helix domain-containing protein n=2 Tax=Leuconostoc mesenteroides TaxID=1245 RepID=UPI000A036A9F